MFLQLFPAYNNVTNSFDESEVLLIANAFAGFTIPGSDIFGPYDLLNFTADGPYAGSMPSELDS